MNTLTKTTPLSREMMGLVGAKRKRPRSGVKMNRVMIAASACSRDETSQSEIILKDFMQDYLDGLSLAQEKKLLHCLEEQYKKVDSLLGDLMREKSSSETKETPVSEKEPMKLKQFY